jgi:hypothetical protein
VHVWIWPPEHCVCPAVQLLVQVSEQAAFGAMPEHTSGAAHVVWWLTYRQPFESAVHVSSVDELSQVVPACVQ